MNSKLSKKKLESAEVYQRFKIEPPSSSSRVATRSQSRTIGLFLLEGFNLKLKEVCKFVKVQNVNYHSSIKDMLTLILSEGSLTVSKDNIFKFLEEVKAFYLKQDKSVYDKFILQTSDLYQQTKFTNQENSEKSPTTSESFPVNVDQWLHIPKLAPFQYTKHTFPRICNIIMKEFNSMQRFSLFQLNNCYHSISKTSEDDKCYYSNLADLFYNNPHYDAGEFFHLPCALTMLVNSIQLEYSPKTHSIITGYFFYHILHEVIINYYSLLKQFYQKRTKKQYLKDQIHPFEVRERLMNVEITAFIGEKDLNVLYLHSWLNVLNEIPRFRLDGYSEGMSSESSFHDPEKNRFQEEDDDNEEDTPRESHEEDEEDDESEIILDSEEDEEDSIKETKEDNDERPTNPVDELTATGGDRTPPKRRKLTH
jgi:hypothetical protein